MLVRMKVGRNLYYPGELVDLPDSRARDWIARGLAGPALCPECGAKLEATGSGVYCPECGVKKWEGIL